MTNVQTSKHSSADTNETYLASIDATLAYIAERLPAPWRSDLTYWLSLVNAAALWAIVALVVASRFGS